MKTLTNSFHQTEYTTRLTEEDLQEVERVLQTSMDDEELRRAKRTARRIWKKLCGINGCTCGDSFGRR